MGDIKIYIDHKKILECPYSDSCDGIFIFENSFQIEQLKEELMRGNPTCFLMSGYRGAGKSSLLKKIESDIQKVKDEKIVFVYVNYPCDEAHNIRLRKLIRAIYQTVLNSKKYEELKSRHKTELQALVLLYERTFSDYSFTSFHKRTHEMTESTSREYDLKKLYVAILALASAAVLSWIDWAGFIKNFQMAIFFDWFRRFIQMSGFLIPFLLVGKYIYDVRIKKRHLNSEEIARKSLYDDEIAEYRVCETLKNLKNALGLNFVFVVDELDKMDEKDEIRRLINEFKPLMLSGLASFILVVGQRFYHQWERSKLADDSIMASIFSKGIHVPLMSIGTLDLLFKKLCIGDPSIFCGDPCKNYIASLVIKSNRSPRRFIGLIREGLQWDENGSYIRISDNRNNEVQILDILEVMEKEHVTQSDYLPGIKDYLVSQLYLSVRKMRERPRFSESDFLTEEKEDYLPDWCVVIRQEMQKTLLQKMVEHRLVKASQGESEAPIMYEWSDADDLEFMENRSGLGYLGLFIEVESLIRSMYIDVSGDAEFSRKSVPEMVRYLQAQEIISLDVKRENDLKEAVKIRNEVAHGSRLPISAEAHISKHISTLDELIPLLLESYSFFVLKQSIERSDMEYSLERQTSFDAIAKIDRDDCPDILFEVKYGKYSLADTSRILQQLVQSLRSYNKRAMKKNYLIILWYLKSNKNEFQLNRIMDSFAEEYPELKGYVYLELLDECFKEHLPSQVKNRLDKVYSQARNFSLLELPVTGATLQRFAEWKYSGLPISGNIQALLVKDLNRERYKKLRDVDEVVEKAGKFLHVYSQEQPALFKFSSDFITKSLGFIDPEFRRRHGFGSQTRDAFEKHRDLA